jgi:hypothetical protein
VLNQGKNPFALDILAGGWQTPLNCLYCRVISETFLRTEAFPLLEQTKREWQQKGSKATLRRGARPNSTTREYVVQFDLQPLECNGTSFRLELVGNGTLQIAIKFIQFVNSEPRPFGPDMMVPCDPGSPLAAIEAFNTLVDDYRREKITKVRRSMKVPR